MDGMLSQEEINALLSGMSPDEPKDAQTEEFLTEVEKDAVGEVANISMGTAATTLYSLVNQRVVITTPVVSYADWDSISNEYDRPCVFVQISYREGLNGKNILVLKEQDVKIITDLMMGGDGTNTDGELGELHLSAISEAMNQMMGSSATSLSSMFNRKIDISPPIASLVDLNDSFNEAQVAPFLEDTFIKIAFKMEIGDLIDSEIMQLYPLEFAREICQDFLEEQKVVMDEMPATPAPQQQETASAPAMGQPDMSQQQAVPQQQMNMGMPQQQMNMGMPQQQMNMGMPMQPMNMGMPMQPMNMGMPMQPMSNMNVQPAQFQQFANNIDFNGPQENINLIMDVPLEVTVELGRTTKSIQNILEMAPGTIIELNRIAGEPVDVLVNGKYVAKGEVVVIEESFGIRVTEIIK